jgi:hypothetical protein
MEKRLANMVSLLTYLLIAALLIAVSLFIWGCSDKAATDPRLELFSSLKGDWVLESVALDNQELQGFEEFGIKFEKTVTPFLYRYQCTDRPELSPWKADGTWQFGSDVKIEMTRDVDTEDELHIVYELENDQLMISFNFMGEGYNSARSASGNWVFVFRKE